MKHVKPEVRTLIVDLETAPNLGYTWGKWEQNVIDFEKGWYILSFAYKWLGDKTVTTVALPDFPAWRKDKSDDRQLVEALWKLFDSADIIVAHNAKSFDIKKSNSRFIHHRLPPPSPYKIFDTLLETRRISANNSNKLDDLGAAWGLGRKLPHTGKHLWLGCMQGDMKAWKQMRAYNAQDVALLEKLYLLIRPWGNHPNVSWITRALGVCPVCQSKHIRKCGQQPSKSAFSYTAGKEAQRFECFDCGKKFQGPWEKLASKITLR